MAEIFYPYSPCLFDRSMPEAVRYGLRLAGLICGSGQEADLAQFDLIFSGSRPLSVIAGCKNDCDRAEKLRKCAEALLREAARLRPLYKVESDGCTFGEPQRVLLTFTEAPQAFAAKQERKNRRLLGKPVGAVTKKRIEKTLKPLRLRLGSSLMQSVIRDRLFVARFNEETFLKGVAAEDKPLLTALSALYAITFHGLDLSDIYCVESIFSADEQHGREKDMIKNRSAHELAEVLSGDISVQGQAVDKMSRTLAKMPVPKADPEDIGLLAENYTRFAGVANMAAACIKLFRERQELCCELRRLQQEDYAVIYDRIRRLMGFSHAVALCDNLAAWRFVRGRRRNHAMSDLKSYGDVQRLSAYLNNGEEK